MWVCSIIYYSLKKVWGEVFHYWSYTRESWTPSCLLILLIYTKHERNEQRGESNEQRAESNEQRGESNEQRAKSNEQRGETNEQRAETNE